MQKNMKRFMMLVAFSAPVCAQAGSANLIGIYNRMDSLENAMTADATRQNLSKTYSGKLDSNLEQLNADLQMAINLANKTSGSMRGSSSVNNMELLIRVTLAAVDTDTLNGFSEAARRNLRDSIGDGLGGYGELEDDANAAMDALDESLGEDTTLNANPNYMRKDTPVSRRVFKDRHHVTRKQRRQMTRQSAWESNQGGQSRRGGGSYQSNNSGFNKKDKNGPKTSNQRKAEAQKAFKKDYGDIRPSASLKGRRADADGSGNITSGAASGVGVTARHVGEFGGDKEQLAINAAKLLRTGSLGNDTRTADQIDADDFADSATHKPSAYAIAAAKK